jgi:hypothetical protein
MNHAGVLGRMGVSLLLGVGLWGCGDAGPVAVVPDAPPSVQPTPDRPRVVRERPSFALDIQEIFLRGGCTAAGCHAAAEPRGGLVLVPGRSHTALVRVRAQSENFLLVDPASPTSSYLMMRLEGRQTVGNRMPLGQTPLDSIDMGNLRNWILTGAENNE